MLSIGSPAPALELEGINGEHYSSRDKLTLAIFFKTSCPTCQYAWPFYERLFRAYGINGLQVFGVSQHDREKTRQFASTYQASFPHLVDDGLRASGKYNPEFVPTGYLIDKKGKIIESFVSWKRSDFDHLSQTIAKTLKLSPPELIKSDEDVVQFKPG